MTTHRQVLTINAGSSSVKVAVYAGAADLTSALKGHLSGIGTGTARFSWIHGAESGERIVDAAAPDAAETLVLAWLEELGVLDSIDGVGHRVVHGFDHTGPVPISPPLLSQLHAAKPYAPEHLPAALRLLGREVEDGGRPGRGAAAHLAQLQRLLPVLRHPGDHHGHVEEEGGQVRSVVAGPPCWLALERRWPVGPTQPTSSTASVLAGRSDGAHVSASSLATMWIHPP